VTNLKLEAWRMWTAYTRRATLEKTIREPLYDLPLNKIPTPEWTANVAYFQMILFADSVVHWFNQKAFLEAARRIKKLRIASKPKPQKRVFVSNLLPPTAVL
jgi:hypothetical protein